MHKKQLIAFIIVALVAGGVGFFGGTAFQSSKKPAIGAFAGRGADGSRAGFARNGGRGAGGAGFVGGEVLSKDDKSVTVKLQDGGSKIVLLSSSSTKVYRLAEVQASDIAVGDQVTVNGVPNDDGSVTAAMIQIRPPMPAEKPAAVIDEKGAREIKVTATSFAFDPAEIRVKQGEKIKLTLMNADGTHGIGIPALGVTIKPSAGTSASQVFVADQKGSFPFFCDVFCGEGHRDMRGILIVE